MQLTAKFSSTVSRTNPPTVTFDGLRGWHHGALTGSRQLDEMVPTGHENPDWFRLGERLRFPESVHGHLIASPHLAFRPAEAQFDHTGGCGADHREFDGCHLVGRDGHRARVRAGGRAVRCEPGEGNRPAARLGTNECDGVRRNRRSIRSIHRDAIPVMVDIQAGGREGDPGADRGTIEPEGDRRGCLRHNVHVQRRCGIDGALSATPSSPRAWGPAGMITWVVSVGLRLTELTPSIVS